MNGFDDLVTQSRVISLTKKIALKSKNSKGKKLKHNEFLDWRCGLATMFNYCPDCGKKIDWEKIRKNHG